jgi:DNA-binding PadR family transcriptional regulator
MDRLPVSEFHILLALAAGPMHGAAIRDDVARRTEDDVVLGPGTLYTSIKRMLARDWIVEVEEAAADVRRFYELTAAGREAVATEAERLERDLEYARRHRLIGPLRPT